MRTILITGANKGIGLETARQLAQLGNFVYVGSRDIRNGEKAVAELKATGITQVAAIQIDVTDIADIRRAQEELSSQIDALDVLINNAGIAGEQPQELSVDSMENVRRLFETNFFGAVQTTQLLLPLLRKSVASAIINVSSEVGSLTMNMAVDRRPNWRNYSAYGASKTALNAFTVMLANELREQNIAVNSVTPGYTATDLNQFKGFKHVSEGARPIVALAMAADSSITGRFFQDGGELPW
ncbi:SDR family NAD(P)-dependent oxidoreductase [Chitinophaga nivalis]|uniref:SDR family NAD(P)-dependent oxidoreductase n=1 Tax=Chitinophaga nivalis TaxID=2991709 RepID=A0ABT3IKV2_9BACT|nr:SDR family NAD(P)-dependent oxidoreductase [Chitinophaga nivalis]MCW3465874.1 SDR family NAD(P)-dependent oxidoreductase [Chitinophaga nivalis]MCW3484435.1 SDR family NAD(P)-dependent oxidoreductase [Chitinophaga nivalis]